jgi:hypothetical protein
MSNKDTLEYNLPQTAYVNFDAVSLKNFIIQRLNENSTFTDQNYEGSNISFLIEILAYYTHVLMFYLNQNSSESLFDQSSIYENMNRIVKLIGYKPTGQQTSIVPVNCVAAADLAIGSYMIRKYSYILVDSIQYTVLNDTIFEKTTNSEEIIQSINDNLILYQGTVEEYPSYIAEGIGFETLPVVVDNLVDASTSKFISDGTLSVYVKETNNNTWYEYKEIDTLYLSKPTDRFYEVRLNESGNYEIKFGNDTFGKQLAIGDEVKVMYILSDGNKGIISKNAINGNKLFTYFTNTFNQIYEDTTASNSQIITTTLSSLLTFSNPLNSTTISEAESVESIKNNAPYLIAAQYRLVTEEDYEKFILKSLPNILNSVKVVDNDRFLGEYIDYYYRICVDPNKVNRVLINQVNFADSCDFNNVNIFCVPKFDVLRDASYPNYLSESFKNLIIDLTRGKKMISSEIVARDPIYTAFDVGFSTSSTAFSIVSNSRIVVVRDKNNKINKSTLKTKVNDFILDFFKPSNNTLGQTLNLSDLTANILGIDGISSIRTENTLENTFFNGLSFLSWNPVYADSDNDLVNQTTTLPFYKFPYFYSPQSLINKIEIIDA